MLHTAFRTLVIVLCVAFVWLAFSPNANAQRFDKGTKITMNTPFQVPGKTLPAGDYVIRLMEIDGNRRVVQIMSATEQKSYAIALGIPDYVLKAPENTHLSFYEVDRGKPLPVHAWFYPGSNFGVEFVYPKTAAVEIAKESGEHVVATTAPEPVAAPTPAELESEPLVVIEPSGEEATVAAVHPEPAPAEAAPAEPVQTAEVLPKTATPFPLFALTGLLAAGVAGTLRMLRRSRS
jgi:LPXTG cell wall anchor motif